MSVEESENVVAAVRSALASDPRVGEIELDVSINANTLVVAGTVSNLERQLAVDEVVVELLDNGYGFRNETQVKHLSEPGEPEEV